VDGAFERLQGKVAEVAGRVQDGCSRLLLKQEGARVTLAVSPLYIG